MSGGRRRRTGRARVAALALLLLAACATSDPGPPLADDAAAAPSPHALAQPRVPRDDPPPPAEPVPVAAAVPPVVPPAGPRPPAAPALEFVKPVECSIDGIVVAPSGEPVRDAQILVQLDVTMPMPRTVRACTGADGRFRVAAPRDRPVVLRVVTPTSPPHGFRHPVEKVRLEAGGAKDLVVRLRAGETIAGRVVDADGNAVAGLRLRTRVPRAMSSGAYIAAETATSADGSFAFDGLPSGFATLVEDRPEGYVTEHVLLDTEQVPTGTGALLVRRMPLGIVTGRVEDATGRPFAKSTVVLARKGAALTVEARTDADGRFRANVAVPGRYVVRLRVATQSGHADRHLGEIDAPAADERTFVAPAVRD